MFEHADALPPDPILGLSELVGADPRPDKIDLTSGVYKDETGRTPTLEVVKEAQERHLLTEESKSYLPIAGLPTYRDAVLDLVFGGLGLERDHLAAAQTPGGTGALSVVARTVRQIQPDSTVWLSDPTWPNHAGVFGQHLADLRSYRYYDAARRAVDVDGLLDDLAGVAAGDVVVLHGCCHNPTGADLDLDTWSRVGALLADRGAVACVDLAYLGLADGIEEDRRFLRPLLDAGPDTFVCVSFSKNLGLYRERVGALAIVGPDATATTNTFGQATRAIRGNYSNPPAWGGSVAGIVLGVPDLRVRWQDELAAIRQRINGVRADLAAALAGRGVEALTGIEDQRGMFCMTGLDAEAVGRLRDEFAIYLVGNGRANVAGLTSANVERFADAIAAVVS